MRWSLRYQLLLPLLMLLVGVVGMSAWTALASAERAGDLIDERMHRIADTVDKVKISYDQKDILSSMKGLSGAEFLLCGKDRKPLKDAKGQAWTTLAVNAAELDEFDDTLPEPKKEWPALSQRPRVKIAGQTYFSHGIPLHRPDQVLYVFFPESLWRDAVWEAVRPSLVVGVIGGLASLILMVAVAQRLSRRFQELERRTRQIAQGDFSPMSLPRRNDELRDLARSVNEMAGQLAQFQETAKKTERLRLLGQVSGGLAHQLRNGVTGARLAVQLHARSCNGHPSPPSLSLAADAEALDVALRQLALLELHLKRFLDLGKASEIQKQRCDLLKLLDETVTLLQPQCRHADIKLDWHAPTDLTEPTLQADRGQLSQMFLNLLTNAIEAAGPGGMVEVVLERTPNRPTAIRIEVRDSGPGPAPEVAARLFEPFVTGKPEGVGLGLAVARQVAEAHGGSIQWRRENHRTCFAVELPIQATRVQVCAAVAQTAHNRDSALQERSA
jgi:signal transduction histidine kinase